MSPLRIALFAAASALSAAAWAQTNANEGPRAVPRAAQPDDAEHAPTRGNAVKNRESADTAKDRASGDAAHDRADTTQGRASGDTTRSTDPTYRLKDARPKDADGDRDDRAAKEPQNGEPANAQKDAQERSSERR